MNGDNMDFNYYQTLVDDAKTKDDKELWVTEYGYPADCPYEPEQLVEVLRIIFEVAHNDIKSLIGRFDKMSKFSCDFRIPYRSVQNWSAKISSPIEHETRLIGYIMIVKKESDLTMSGKPEDLTGQKYIKS